jgi:hypothetical protein
MIDYMNFLDTLDPIYTISFEEYFNVTKEQLEQSKKEAARKARMEILSHLPHGRYPLRALDVIMDTLNVIQNWSCHLGRHL